MVSSNEMSLVCRSTSLSKRFSPLLARGISITAILVSGLVLSGWLLDIGILQRGMPAGVTMKPMTAVGFVLAGIALWLLVEPGRSPGLTAVRLHVTRACAVVIIALGLLTLGQYSLGWDHGIDRLLFPRRLAALPQSYPGRMAAATAVGFLCLGLALVCATVNVYGNGWWSQTLALLTGVLGCVALLGHAYGIEALYQWSPYSSVALPTSSLFVLFGIGVLCARPDSGFMAAFTGSSSGSVMARRMVPAAIVLPFMVGWLRLVGERAGLYKTEVGLAIFTTANIAIFTGLVGLRARLLNRLDRQRSQDEDVIRRHTAELARVNEKLRLNAERLRLVITGAGLVNWRWDVRTSTLAWSENGPSLFGLSPGPPMDYGVFLAALHPEDRSRVEEEMVRALAERTEYDLEYRTIWPDGREHWLAMKGRGFYSHPDESHFMEGIALDITERKQIELSLREEEARLRLMVEAAPNGVVLVDQYGIIVQANRELARIFGYTQEALVGMAVENLLPSRMRENHIHDRQAFQARPEARLMGVGRDLYGQRQDGHEFPVEVGLSPLQTPRGAFVLATVVDMSERQRMTEALREQAEVLDLAQVLVQDLDHRIVLWTRGAEALYGFSREEAMGGITYELLHTEFSESLSQILDTLHHTGIWEGELVHRKRDGSPIVVTSQWVLSRDRAGQPHRILRADNDITARKKMEEAVRQTQKLEALGTLAGGIAHDFNNILSAIRGNNELAMQDTPTDHSVQRHLREIANASRRATELVRRILAFSRSQNIRRTAVPLQPVVEEALKLLRATLPAMIAIEATFADDVPDVVADATQIHQVVLNLGTNAAQAMEARGGRLGVRLMTVVMTPNKVPHVANLHAGTYVRLSVSDTGRGMEKAILQRIFEPFFTTKPPGQGTGIGLSVVHRIMQDHEGAIEVYSEPGQGSVFHCYFPATVPLSQAATSSEADEIIRGHGEHLLYVDDEPALVDIFHERLQRLGYRVTGYSSPLQALQAFQAQPHAFDIVVTDLAMPRMSGLDLAGALLRLRPEIPIVLTSGYLQPEAQMVARRLGIRATLAKPLEMSEVSRLLRQLLSAPS